MKVEKLKTGTLINKVEGKIKEPILNKEYIHLSVPARLNMMCFDLKTLVEPEEKAKYKAGELLFSVGLNTEAKIKVIKDKKSNLKISDNSTRVSLIKHAAIIMRKILNVDDTWQIEAKNLCDFPHAGLGTSSSLLTSVCLGLNILYGEPLTKRQLSLFITQNHVEEVSGEIDEVVHVQCNGGSPSAALYGGGMQIMSGNSVVLMKENLPEEYTFVFGIPNFYEKKDAYELMKAEEKSFPDMISSSENYSKEIAWKVLHLLLPAVKMADVETIGEVLRYYRFETGSLKNDSYIWPNFYDIVKEIYDSKPEDVPILSVSSCGPAIFGLTKDESGLKSLFESFGYKTFSAKANNEGYIIHEKE